MNELLQAALDYANRGWPIFPCRTDKTPYTKNGVNDATTNTKQIKKWWVKYPNGNIALDVGGAGMMVVDLDPGHSMEEIEANVGKLPKTKLAASTPRGGKHLFYELDQGETVPPSASKIAKHVDIRSFHSYVLLEPSSTADGDYTWDSEGGPAYRTDKMVEVSSAVREKDERWDDWIIEADIPENIALAIKWLRETAKPAIEGQGGDMMAYSTAAMCKSYGLSPNMALDLMWEHWNPRCSPPWEAHEIEHLEEKIINGYSYNTSPPGNMTPAYKVARANELFSPVSRDTKGGGKETKVGRFRFVDREGMEDIKPPEWLIKDAIPENSYCLLVGPRGTFKTFIALDMALSVATGSPFEDWLGPWPDVKEGNVLFAAGEGRGNIKNRVQAWEQVHYEGDKVHSFTLVDPVPSPNVDDTTAFIEGALDLNDSYSLVVLDTVGRSMQGLNENSQQDASQFTLMVQTIQQELDCAVLAIHHTGHKQDDRSRGSSVFGADVDAEFVLERNDKDHVVFLKNTKQKDAPEWEAQKAIKLDEVHIDTVNKSLVAVHSTKTPATTKAAKEAVKKRARGVDQQILGKVVHEVLKKNKAAEYTQVALAEAVAVFKYEGDSTPAIAQSFETLKKKPLSDLRESAHPSAKYYIAPMGSKKGYWSFNK